MTAGKSRVLEVIEVLAAIAPLDTPERILWHHEPLRPVFPASDKARLTVHKRVD
jgi:hypothetical protein